MATEFFLLTLLRTQLAASVAILVVIFLRPSVRRELGPVLGYKLWGLVPAAMAASLMPGLAEWIDGGVVHLSARGASRPVLLQAITLLDFWSQAAPATLRAWASGALGLGTLFVAGEVCFRRRAAQGLAGPAVVGIAAPRLVVPADFRVRYDEKERELIRLHERTHVEENHPQANLALGLFQVVGWFNPLAHLAATAFRLDQELACDALVLEGRRRDRRAYAGALMKAYTSAPVGRLPPLSAAWRAGAPHPLVTRLAALRREPLGVIAHVRGAVCIASAAGVLAAVIWSVAPTPALSTQPAAGLRADPPPTLFGAPLRSG